MSQDDYDLPLARRTAGILGRSCAAARAIAEYERRAAAGEDVAVIRDRVGWHVVPRATLTEAMGQ